MFTITNQGTNEYTLIIDETIVNGTAESEPVDIEVRGVTADVSKEPDGIYVELNDIIPYRITITNTGDVDFTTVDFTDYLPSELTVEPGTFRLIDGLVITPLPGDVRDLTTLPISLPPGKSVIVAFDAKVVSYPLVSPYDYENFAEVIFHYQLDPELPEETLTIFSNTVYAYPVYPEADFSVLKEVKKTSEPDSAYTTVKNVYQGEEVTYRITITNIGEAGFIGGVINDTLNGDLTIVPGSIRVNGSPRTETGNNLVNVPLPALTVLPPTNVIIVTFRATVTGPGPLIPNVAYVSMNDGRPNSIITVESNEAVLYVRQLPVGGLTITKCACPKRAALGTVIYYKVVLTNNTGETVSFVDFTDILDSDLTLVPGSIYVDGVQQPTLTNPSEIVLSPLPATVPPSKHVITYAAVVTGTGNEIRNQASADYVVDESTIVQTAVSNEVIISAANPSIVFTKSVDKCVANIDDKLLYTITILNKGNVDIPKLLLTDFLDKKLSIVEGTIKINGVDAGVNKIWKLQLPALPAPVNPANPTSIVVTFEATVDKLSIPYDGCRVRKEQCKDSCRLHLEREPFEKDQWSCEENNCGFTLGECDCSCSGECDDFTNLPCDCQVKPDCGHYMIVCNEAELVYGNTTEIWGRKKTNKVITKIVTRV